jgi:hypothetical protein
MIALYPQLSTALYTMQSDILANAIIHVVANKYNTTVDMFEHHQHCTPHFLNVSFPVVIFIPILR